MRCRVRDECERLDFVHCMYSWLLAGKHRTSDLRPLSSWNLHWWILGSGVHSMRRWYFRKRNRLERLLRVRGWTVPRANWTNCLPVLLCGYLLNTDGSIELHSLCAWF